jgi:hypothetical protein
MASHHKHHMKHKKARGGSMHESHFEADDQGSPEMKEAKEKKHGGRVHGHKGKHRTKKARGGGVGSDKHPFSSAYTASTEAK